MVAFKMVWYGPIVPYVRTTQRQKWVDKRYKKYQAWKDAFRLSANTQGFPSDLDPSMDYAITLRVYLVGARRFDVDNFCKGSLDSLFTQDTRVASIKVDAEEYAGVDRVEVELVERGARVKSGARRAAKPKPVQTRRKAMRWMGGSLPALDGDVQGNQRPPRSEESPCLGGLQSGAEEEPED